MISKARLATSVALVFTTGCSLLWDMDPYERGAAEPRDGGSGSGSSGAPSSTSSGAPSALPEDAAPPGDAAGEPGCHGEAEPNDSRNAPQELRPGRTCARIEDVHDKDHWSVVGPATVTITLESGMIVTTFPGDTTTPRYIDEPGPAAMTFGAGTHVIAVQSFGFTGDYGIAR